MNRILLGSKHSLDFKPHILFTEVESPNNAIVYDESTSKSTFFDKLYRNFVSLRYWRKIQHKFDE